MTPQQFRALLKRLGLTQIDAATFLRVRPTTVNRWATGKRKVPGPVVAALECLQDKWAFQVQAGSTQLVTSATGTGPTTITGLPIEPVRNWRHGSVRKR